MKNGTNLSPAAGSDGKAGQQANDRGAAIETALTLHFAAGMRPDVDAVLRTAARPADSTAFMVSYMPEPDEGWLELLAMGLTYDISGLAPHAAAPAVLPEHFYGIEAASGGELTEAVRLVPGEHIVTGRMMLPVLRILAGLGAELARLPGLRAVGWEQAQSWMAPAYFMSAIRAWLSGGAFPALGLTSLQRNADGTMATVGLSLFTGLEVELAPLAGEAAQDAAKLMARTIHQLVHSADPFAEQILGLNGECIETRFDAGEGILHLWRKG